MTLAQLSQMTWPSPPDAAPDWLLGCFQRRSITFYSGACDTDTQVFWLQARGLAADFRIPTCAVGPEEALRQRTNFEGGLSRTAWDGHAMRWFDWTSFQLHDKWTEPGLLRRVGDCVTEFAPSGAYVEDWRFQRSHPGPVVGLRLLHEKEAESGTVTHSGGGLIVCGDHAALVRGRTRNLHGLGRLSDIAQDASRGASRDTEFFKDLFAFEASYAAMDASGEYKIQLSTHPARVGEALSVTDGFSFDPETELVTQRLRDGDVDLERVFSIDTLEPNWLFSSATEVSTEAEEWLHRESDTLLAFADKGSDPR